MGVYWTLRTGKLGEKGQHGRRNFLGKGQGERGPQDEVSAHLAGQNPFDTIFFVNG